MALTTVQITFLLLSADEASIGIHAYCIFQPELRTTYSEQISSNEAKLFERLVFGEIQKLGKFHILLRSRMPTAAYSRL